MREYILKVNGSRYLAEWLSTVPVFSHWKENALRFNWYHIAKNNKARLEKLGYTVYIITLYL